MFSKEKVHAFFLDEFICIKWEQYENDRFKSSILSLSPQTCPSSGVFTVNGRVCLLPDSFFYIFTKLHIYKHLHSYFILQNKIILFIICSTYYSGLFFLFGPLPTIVTWIMLLFCGLNRYSYIIRYKIPCASRWYTTIKQE